VFDVGSKQKGMGSRKSKFAVARREEKGLGSIARECQQKIGPEPGYKRKKTSRRQVLVKSKSRLTTLPSGDTL
jgi:hypothetical protein